MTCYVRVTFSAGLHDAVKTALAKSISPLANANKNGVGLIKTPTALAQMANKNS